MIFNRWCLRELVKTICISLSAFYLLYVLIDYSSRISNHHAIRFEWLTLFEYYGLIFIRRLEVLLPFALLIATASTLQTIWQLHGWIPLLQGGRPLTTLLRPFYAVAILSTVFLLYSEEALIPFAMKRLNHIESLYFHKGEGISELNTRASIRLKEGGVLFFGSFDAKEQTLYDVWYLPHWNELVHIEQLDISHSKPVGYLVDAFTLDHNGIEEKKFADKELFDQMHVTWRDLLKSSIDPLNLSISELFYNQFEEVLSPPERNEYLATLLKKLLFPFLAFLAVLSIPPFFVSFQRDIPFLLYYLAAVLGYVGFYLFISSLYVVSSANVLSPWIALPLPMGALLFFLRGKWKRLVFS